MTAEEVAHACGPDTEHCSCVSHLRAEIERLRAQRILSNEDFARSFDLGLAAGERRERAAVVAWLHDVGTSASMCADEMVTLHWVARAIYGMEHVGAATRGKP